MANKKRRYFERPDEGEQPLTIWETLVIVLSTHLGVRPRSQRENDFRRANGLHLFIAGIIYFVLLLLVIITLVNIIAN